MHKWFVILSSLMFALVLALLPMPDWAVWLRPSWVLMVLIYWVMAIPGTVNVGAAWLIGLVVDLVNGSALGEHALAYALIAYLVYRLHTQLRMYPIVQQSLAVMVFILFYQFILYCIQGFIGELPSSRLYWLAPVISMLLWPWLYILMGDCQRRFRVV